MRDQLQLQQPQKLENLTLIYFIKWMISPVDIAMKPRLERNTYKIVRRPVHLCPEQVSALKKYVNNLPGLIQQKLLAKLMEQLSVLLVKHFPEYRTMRHERSTIVEEYNIIGVILQVLFTENIQVLKLGYNEMKRFGGIFGNKGYMLGGLTDLQLDILLESLDPDEDEKNDENDEAEKDDKAERDNTFYQEYHYIKESNILMFLKNLHNLKRLTINCCTDKVLRCIIEHCKTIETLELYCDLNFKSDVVELLTELPNLISIDLYVSLLDITEECKIEKQRRQLFLELIARQKKFYIKSYARYTTESSHEDLQVVIKTYPLIQSLSLCSRGSTHSLDLYKETLAGLKNLEKLDLSCFDFYGDRVKEVLDSVGGNLKELAFQLNSEIDLNVMKIISLNFPMLQKLTIKLCSFKELDATSTFVIPNITSPAFPYLQSFRLSPVGPSKNHLSSILFVLSNCPSIKNIIIDEPNVNERVMLDILDKNSLSCLTHLTLHDKLTDTVLDRILESGQSPEVVINNRGWMF